jgi:hypothetical protein
VIWYPLPTKKNGLKEWIDNWERPSHWFTDSMAGVLTSESSCLCISPGHCVFLQYNYSFVVTGLAYLTLSCERDVWDRGKSCHIVSHWSQPQLCLFFFFNLRLYWLLFMNWKSWCELERVTQNMVLVFKNVKHSWVHSNILCDIMPHKKNFHFPPFSRLDFFFFLLVVSFVITSIADATHL